MAKEQRKTLTLEEEKTEQRPAWPWYVILHDDQQHTYDYVVRMLCDLVPLDPPEAFLHACEVDATGVTIVARKPKGEAANLRDCIMNYGGDPLMKSTVSMRASIEPADD